jgi:TIR domain
MIDSAYDVFISYRRDKGGAEARLIRAALAEHGLRVFLDVTDLSKGHFDEALLRYIAATPSFIVILSPDALDPRIQKQEDWMRREVAHAILTGRNIVPVLFPQFEFPAQLPEDIKDLPRHQGVKYSHDFFEAVIDKILRLIGVQPVEKRPGAIERQDRALDAALPQRIPVGRATEFVAMIRRTESKGLKAILEIEEDSSITAGDVRSRGLELEFPLDANGEPRSAELVLRLDAPDFEPRSQSKRVLVPPQEDSELYTFLLTAQRIGELRVNLEVLKGDLCVVTRALKTLAEQQTSEFLKSGSVLISIPLYVHAYQTDTSQVPGGGNKTLLASAPVDVVGREEVRARPDGKHGYEQPAQARDKSFDLSHSATLSHPATRDEHYRGEDSTKSASPQSYGEQRDPHEDTREAMPAPVAAYQASSPPQSLHRSSRNWPAIIALSRIVALVFFVVISISVAVSSAPWLSAAWIVAAEACIVLFLGPWVWRRFRK